MGKAFYDPVSKLQKVKRTLLGQIDTLQIILHFIKDMYMFLLNIKFLYYNSKV